MNIFFIRMPLLITVLAGTAYAADPLDPQAPVAPVGYTSPYQNFRATDAGLKPGMAQTVAPAGHELHHPSAAATTDGEGTIVSISTDHSKIKLNHGPIPKLDMPPMTMTYKVKSPALLKGLQNGDKVGFGVEEQNGDYVITGLKRLEN